MENNDLIKKQIIAENITENILSIRLDIPKKKNALHAHHLSYIVTLLENAKEDSQVKIVYITGTGDNFTSGNDFNSFADLTFDEMAEGFRKFIEYLIYYPKVLVAGVNGMNIGMGFTMLMHFDIILCSDNAFFQVPFIQTLQAPEGTSSALCSNPATEAALAGSQNTPSSRPRKR